MASIIELVNNARSEVVGSNDWFESRAYRCHVCVVRDDDRWSVMVLNLPGTGSCGDTEQEAMENVREAIAGVIESYCEHDEEIPWTDSNADDIPVGARHKWILVEV